MGIERKLNNISGKEYCNIHNFKYSVQRKESSQKIYLANYSGNPDNDKYIEVMYPEIYTAELNNVNIIGANYIIFDENNYCIYDMPFRDDENKYDLKCNNIIYADKKNTLINYNESIQNIDEGIMLIAGCSQNFSHFQIEVLSKLCLINGIKEYIDVPILIDEICFSTQAYLEEIQMLNKNGRKIIILKNGVTYNIKKLIYISDLSIFPINTKEGYLAKHKDCVLCDIGIKLLNENLSIKSNISRKLFISRRNAWNSKLENQNSVEQIFAENGYEMIFPELMSFAEKLKIFSEAKIIAGALGSGFTNVLFADKDVKLICIHPKAIESTFLSNIAGILGQKLYYLDAELSKLTTFRYYQNPYIIDEEYLRKFLNQFS